MQLKEDNVKEAGIFHEVQRLLILDEVQALYDVIDQWAAKGESYERFVRKRTFVKYQS